MPANVDPEAAVRADRKRTSAASGRTTAKDRPKEGAPEDPGDEIGAEQQGRHHHAEEEQECVTERVGEPLQHDRNEAVGIGDHVPGVEAWKAPEVDPDRAEHERAHGDRPADDAPGPRLDDVVHEEQRAQPEGKARGGEGADERGVEPQRCAAYPPEMDEVGEDVRRVGQEEQPAGTEHPQQWAWSTPTVNGRQTEREHKRNPREEEVPPEEDEGGLTDPVDSDSEQPDRGEGQGDEGEGQPGQPVRRPMLQGARHASTLERPHTPSR